MSYLVTYPENDYRLYLAHHGIKGQRWGVRRYQNIDGTLTDAGRKHVYGSGKTGAIERTKIRVQNVINTHRDIARNTKNAKGIVNKASELVGHGAARTKAENNALTQLRLKEASKTRLGKAYHEGKSYNMSSAAQYHAIKKNQSLARRAGELIIPVTALQMPMKTITGRRTTVAQEALLAATTAGIGKVALDLAYAKSSKRNGKLAKQLSFAGDVSKDYYKSAAKRADSAKQRQILDSDIQSIKKNAPIAKDKAIKSAAAASAYAEKAISKSKKAIESVKEDYKKEKDKLKKR